LRAVPAAASRSPNGAYELRVLVLQPGSAARRGRFPRARRAPQAELGAGEAHGALGRAYHGTRRFGLTERRPLPGRLPEQAGSARQLPQLRALVVADRALRRPNGRVSDQALHPEHFLDTRAVAADRVAPAIARERAEPFPDSERGLE